MQYKKQLDATKDKMQSLKEKLAKAKMKQKQARAQLKEKKTTTSKNRVAKQIGQTSIA